MTTPITRPPLPLFVGLWALSLLACSVRRDPGDETILDVTSRGSTTTTEGPRELPPAAPQPPAEVPIYLNTAYTLYKFSPPQNTLTRIGDFDCLLANMSGTADSGMHDLAIDSRGRMFGVAKVGGIDPGSYSNQVIVSIDKETASCTSEFAIANNLVDPRGGLELRGLSFLPQGTISASEETLVALEIYGSYLQIDLNGKQATLRGSLNGTGTGPYRTKGADIVSINGAATYSTAQGAQDDERLVVLDPRNGQVQKDLGSLGRTIFGGLAYWGGTLYGFTLEGRIFSVDPATARTTEVLIGVPADTHFEGAAVTPSAPIFPPG